MPVIELATSIAAPIDRVFDLARSIDLHTNSTSGTGERAVAGVTSGLIGPEQEVTWRARHHHYFEKSAGGTTMRDVFSFQSPLGILGRIADSIFLTCYMKSFLVERNRVIKATAESDDWKQYIRNA